MSLYNKTKKVVFDDITFDSKMEYEYYKYLLQQKELWIIERFTFHESFILIPWFEKLWKKNRPITYESDFVIYHLDWHKEVIDIKWFATEKAIMKRKIFDYIYREIPQRRIVKYNNQRVDYDDNEKRKRDNRKSKVNILLPKNKENETTTNSLHRQIPSIFTTRKRTKRSTN